MTFRLAILFVALAAAACSEFNREQPWRGAPPETEAEFELCEYGKKWSPTMIVRHQEPDGRLFFGDVTSSQGYVAKGWTTIRSAKAQPVEEIYRVPFRTDCYDEAKDVYYPCVQSYELDLREVGAVIRSNHADPAELATSYCAQAARQAWKDKFGSGETNDSQICAVTARAICLLPGVTPDAAPETSE